MPTGTMSASARLPYFRGGRRGTYRPRLRGLLVSFLNKGLWATLAVVHFGFCATLPQKSELIFYRSLVWTATLLNVHFSDKYHNGDTAKKPTKELECFWLRCDFVGIAAVLAATFALWSSHFHWHGMLKPLAVLSGTCIAGVAAPAYLYLEREFYARESELAESLIKLMFATQFFGCFSWMVYLALQTNCAVYTLIYFIYAPGVVLYALNWPRDNELYGAHDLFHVAVILGHLSSAFFDAWHLYKQEDCLFEQ